jgi:putative flippase GtrA
MEKEQNTVQGQTKKQLLGEIFRFLIVGGTATVADYATFYVFRQWILPARLIAGNTWDIISLIIATALGFLVGLVLNWILSVKFVFRDVRDKEEAASKKSFLIFTVIGVMGLAITELGILLLVHIFPEITLFGVTEFLLPWKEWLAKAIMTCIVLVFNYVGRKLFVFKS